MFDRETATPLSPLLAHGDEVASVVFTPIHERALTTSGDGTLRIWAASGQPLTPEISVWDDTVPRPRFELLGASSLVNATACSPDGRRVVTGALDGSARVWDVAPDDRPRADLIALAELLSGQRLDAGGAPGSLTADELMRLWDDLRGKYPEEFTITPAQTRAWRKREIRDCVREGNLAAAQFHHWAQVADAALAGGK